MQRPSIHQRYSDNILIGATVTPTPAPMATYTANTLLTHRPGDRVRWSTGTVNLRFDLPAPMRADLLVIPCWNVIDESEPVVTLESDAGLSVPIAVPTMMPSGIPRTTAADLELLEADAAKRTSNGFNLIIDGNAVNLIMGGCVLLYGPKRTFDDTEWGWDFSRDAQYYAEAHENEYGTDLVSTKRTRRRAYNVSTMASREDAETIELWADANFANGLPGLIWPRPDLNYEAYFGRLDAMLKQAARQGDGVEIALTFTEISKGKPVA